MKLNYSLIILLILFGAMSASVVGQTNSEKISQKDLLPPLSEPPTYELVLRYIDDALVKAFSSGSNLIVIVKIKKTKKFSSVRNGLNCLKNYMLFRGFKNFEVAIDPDTDGAEQIELHVQGERLYILPLKKKEKLDLSVCSPDI